MGALVPKELKTRKFHVVLIENITRRQGHKAKCIMAQTQDRSQEFMKEKKKKKEERVWRGIKGGGEIRLKPVMTSQ
jgi:hypothetical protein